MAAVARGRRLVVLELGAGSPPGPPPGLLPGGRPAETGPSATTGWSSGASGGSTGLLWTAVRREGEALVRDALAAAANAGNTRAVAHAATLVRVNPTFPLPDCRPRRVAAGGEIGGGGDDGASGAGDVVGAVAKATVSVMMDNLDGLLEIDRALRLLSEGQVSPQQGLF